MAIQIHLLLALVTNSTAQGINTTVFIYLFMSDTPTLNFHQIQIDQSSWSGREPALPRSEGSWVRGLSRYRMGLTLDARYCSSGVEKETKILFMKGNGRFVFIYARLNPKSLKRELT